MCIDCGKPSLGTRCRPCNGRHIQLETARQFAAKDAELLAEVEAGLTPDRLAARLGFSRARGWAVIRNARRRQRALVEAGAPEPSGS